MPPKLVPVSGDPFASAPAAGPKLVPVSGDPFAQPKPPQPAQTFSRPNIVPHRADPVPSAPVSPLVASLVGQAAGRPAAPTGLVDRELAMTPQQSATVRARTARDNAAITAQRTSSAGGAAARSAARGALPAVAGAGGFGAGFTAAGVASAPLNAVPGWGTLANGAIATLGGLAGAMGLSMGTNYLQDKALDALPENVTTAIGQDPAQRAADEAQHPYASFAGSLAPSLLTMRPSFGALPAAPEGASLLTRALSSQAGSRIIGGTLGGATEAGSELASGDELDPAKIAMATGTGALLNRPTALGDAMFRGGANAALRGVEVAGRAYQGARNVAEGVARSARDAADIRAGRLIEGQFTEVPQPQIAPPMPPEAPAAPLPAEPVAPTGPEGGSVAPAAPAAPSPLKLVPVVGNPFAAPPPGPDAPASTGEGAAQPAALPAPAPAAPSEGGLGLPPEQPKAAAPTPEPQQAPAQPAPLRPEPGPVGEGERLVRTPGGGQVRTRFEVVDASQLHQAEGANQNRDRSRDTTGLQVQDIVGKFDPELLHEDPSTDRGAPIVGEDNAIDSGNGRMLALNAIYAGHPELAARYRAMIEGRGFSTEGMERPVLIQRRLTEMTPEQRRQFVIDSNKDTKLELSPVERARSDADSITPEMLAKYAGGDLNSTANAGFVQAFNSRLTTGEMGNMIGSDRRLTTAGTQRIENAIVAHAYGNPKLLERMLESDQDDIRAITGSMADVAAPWARMRADVRAGEIDKSLDITDQLADAAARVSDARKRGIKPADILSQADAFDPIDPTTAELIRGFYNSGMTRAASRKSVTELLHNYLDQAGQQQAAAGLFGDEPVRSPASILRDLLDQRDNPQGAGLALDTAEGPNHEANGAPQGHEGRDEVAPGRHEEEGRPQAPAAEGQAGPRGSGRAADVAGSGRGRGSRGEGSGGVRSAEGPGVLGDREEVEDKPDYSEGRGGPVLDRSPYDPDFLAASFTNRTSIFNSAAEALGMDPDKFTLLPAPRQVELLRRAVNARFGIDALVDKGMQERFAIDQMLDAYQNVQGMAHVLGLPAHGISLGGTLSIRLQKGGNFLGAFAPDKNLIMLPKRSNSFAHEWGHALDWHLLHMLDSGDAPGRGLTGALRQRGDALANGDLPANVREAMVDLLNAMFFDKAAQAGAIMQLEAKIAQTKSEKVKAEAQAQIDRIRGGNSQLKSGRTAFYQGAKSFDGPGGDYWTSPTEMFARAFEAYVSYRADAAGLTTEFIGKGDANYLSNAEDRFAKTFPKGEERARIFAAFENTFARIGAEALLGQGEAAEKPAGSARRLTDYDKQPATTKEGSLIERELASIRDHQAQARKDIAGRPNNPKGVAEMLNDLRGAVFMSMTGELRMIQARSKSPSLQRLIDTLTKQDGRGDRTVARTFDEDVHLQSKRNINRVANILKANGIKLVGRSPEDDMMLRDLLIGAREDGEPNFVKAAAAIRHVLDEEWHVNQKAGIDLGYTRNGYLARVLDLPKVYGDQQGFVRDASKVYELVFDNEYTDADTVLADDDRRRQFMRQAALLMKYHGADFPSMGEVRALLKKANKIASAAAAAAKAGDGEKADKFSAQLAEMQDELGELFGQLYDEVKPAWANARAEEWLAKINLHAGEEHNAASPDSKYTKKRALPPETDKIMEKFFLSDPVESVTRYLQTSARRTAYARRFGADGKKRAALFEGMAREGVSPEDQVQVARILDTATGRVRTELPAAVQQSSSFMNMWGMMALLPRAVLSSLAEPFTAGLVTGNALDGFKMMGAMIHGALGTPSGRHRYELARAMGIISDMGSDTIMMARSGQSYADDTRFDRYLAEMFRATGLTALTHAQKTAGVGLGHAFLDNLAGKIEQGGKPGEDAEALMRELGIRDPKAFAAELLKRNGLPTVEELDSEFGHDYATAQLRFSGMVVQEPNAMDRPLLSHNPIGRLVYGITGFSYAYWRNIIKRNGILIGEKWKRDKGAAALYGGAIMAAAALAYFVNTTISTIREYLLNPARWDDLQKRGELESTMLQLGFTRAFSLGAADPIIQAYSGLKYQRDLSNVAIGPAPGFLLQNGQKVLQLTSRNSRKTNAAEYNAIAGTWSNLSPFAAMAIARAPGAGPLVTLAKGVGMAEVTSPAVRDMIASTLVGPRDSSKTKTKTPTAYDRMLDATLGAEERKKR